MTFFEYIKNEATVEQIAYIFHEIEMDLSDDRLYDTEDIIRNILLVTNENPTIDSDYINVLNWDLDEYNKVYKEINELCGYIKLIEQALENYNNDKLYELVNIVIHKYKDYVVIVDKIHEKEIRFKYNKYGYNYNKCIVHVKSKIYEQMVANNDK